jgi:hypothetical protein
MSQIANRKQPRFSLGEKLLLIGIGTLLLAALVLGVLTGLTVVARGPRPRPTPEPINTPMATPIPLLFPSIRVSPEEAKPGQLIIVIGEGWTAGDEISIHVIGPSGDEWFTTLETVQKDGGFVAPFFLPADVDCPDGSSALVRASSRANGDEVLALLPLLAEETPSPLPTAQPTLAPRETPAPSDTPGQTPTAVRTVKATPRPAETTWRGEYYSNRYLAGLPGLIRDDASLNFVWGAGAPTASLPSDGFSVRWTRTPAFESGTYRFYAVSDDGVRVWLDGACIIDEWHDAAGATYSADRTLSAGDHTLRVDYFENAGTAQIRVWWEKLGAYPDWRGEYWSNRLLSGSPVLVRNDRALDFNWGWGSPAAGLPDDGFSARWTRTAQFEAATYRFHVVVDDGARLYVDDQLILDTWRDGASRQVTRDYALARGAHNLRAEFYEQSGEARIRVWWEKVSASYPDWQGEYWSNRKFEGKPALVRNDRSIDFRWGTGAVATGLPADSFSARWSRRVSFDRGAYRFYAWADDGIRVYVDGDLVLDEWRDASADEVSVVDLTLDGRKALVVEYYERSGEALVKFWWKRVGDWPTPTPTATPTATPTSTPEPTATPTATMEPSVTPTPTVEPTIEPTVTPTATPEPTPTPTPTPTPEPGPSSVFINEVLPVPAQDGIIDELDEWIELHNAGTGAVDLSGWFLDDGEGDSEPYRMVDGLVLQPGAFLVLHGRTTGLVLNDSGDTVRLLNPDGVVVDAVAFDELAQNANQSRDELGGWHDDWPPSPGEPNQPPPLIRRGDASKVAVGVTPGARALPWMIT